MAIGASGGVPAPGGQRLAVNTFDDIAGLLFVALAAGFGQVGKMERRSGRGRGQDAVGAVAIDALRSGMRAVADVLDAGIAVDARSVRERLFLMAARAVDRLRRNVVVRMFGRQIAVATGAGSLLMRRTGDDRGIRQTTSGPLQPRWWRSMFYRHDTPDNRCF